MNGFVQQYLDCQKKFQHIMNGIDSYTMANEGLWNITAPSLKDKPGVEGGL